MGIVIKICILLQIFLPILENREWLTQVLATKSMQIYYSEQNRPDNLMAVGKRIFNCRRQSDYVHTGPDEFETVLKFVRLQLFTRNQTNYRPKSVHTEPDEFVPEIIC